MSEVKTSEKYHSLVNLRPDSVLSLADEQEDKLDDLRKAKRDLEQELKQDLQQFEALENLFNEAVVVEDENAKLYANGPASKVYQFGVLHI